MLMDVGYLPVQLLKSKMGALLDVDRQIASGNVCSILHANG